MEKIACEACGSSDLVKEGEYFVCQYCGVKYTPSAVKKMLGTVKIDNTDKLRNLYQIARRAKDDCHAENAAKYYDMILVEDPNSWEASFYLVYFKASQCTIAQIETAAGTVTNCIDTVLELIRDHVDAGEEQEQAVEEVALRCRQIADAFYSSAKDQYDGIDPQIRAGFTQEMLDRCLRATDIMYALGNNIESIFPNSYALRSAAAGAWKDAIAKHNSLMIYFNDKEANKKFILDYVAKVHKYEPAYKPPVINTRSGCCYVATCVYGSYDCPPVWTLRRYRDQILAQTWYGRAFIHTYYALSPTMVQRFGDTCWFRRLFKGKLDGLVRRLNAAGIGDTPYNDRAG